jgi:hypothetical protein
MRCPLDSRRVPVKAGEGGCIPWRPSGSRCLVHELPAGSRAMAPRLVIDGILPRWLHARTVFSPAPARAVNIVAPGILYISEAYIDLTVGDINDQFRQSGIIIDGTPIIIFGTRSAFPIS